MTNMSNGFIKANTIGAGANGARTENGAISYATIGSALLDQFGKAGSFRGRDIMDVWADQAKLWSEDPENALKFPFYLRMITRQSNILNGGKTEKVQKGQGNRDEAFKRLLWIAKYHPDEFYLNLWLLPIVGSWKDLWTLLSFDGADEYLKAEKFFEVMAEGIGDPNHKDLVKKYMPRIRSDKKCTTHWAKSTNLMAKMFAKTAGWSYKEYREFKATGVAHKFQTYICKGLYSNIDWKTIPGKALLNLVSGKFLKAHNLENNYIEWLKTQPVAKFNGYAYELGRKLKECNFNPALATKITIDKQFDGLIQTASKNGGAIEGNVLCALDTSGSMGWNYLDKERTLTPYEVCVSLGVYFSELNQGAFHNVVAMFDDTSRLMTLSGTFTDKYTQIRRSSCAMGGTNFQSLIDLIVNTRKKSPEIPLEDFPKTLLVVSDMQFNPSNGYSYGYSQVDEKTNYEAAMQKLRTVFPEEFVKDFKIIWWFCSNERTTDFPSTMEDGGTYMLSGFDGAVVSFILGGDMPVKVDEKGNTVQPSMDDIVNAALNQEVLALVKR
jgi:hypothetical protein